MKKLNLFGVVYNDQSCVNATAVSQFLSELGQDEQFEVYINSPGGSVFEGLAIYNLLAEYSNQMTIKIIGEASSIASVISCAGKVMMAESALMLIHKPWTFAIVDEDYIAKLSKELDTIKNSIIKVYKRKTGMSESELNQMMTDGEYHNADKMVTLGFADSVYVPSEADTALKNQSDMIVNAHIRKYMVMNLKVKDSDINFNSQTKEFSMTLEEALGKIGNLENVNKTLETTNAAHMQKVAEYEAQVKQLTVSLDQYKTDTEKLVTENKAYQEKLDVQQQEMFNSEATEFCNKLVSEMKMTPAEKETQVKVLVNFRKSNTMFDEKTSMYDQVRTSLAARQPINGLDEDLPDGEEIPAGGAFAYNADMESTDEGRVQLDTEIRSRMAKNNSDYSTELQNIRKGA